MSKIDNRAPFFYTVTFATNAVIDTTSRGKGPQRVEGGRKVALYDYRIYYRPPSIIPDSRIAPVGDKSERDPRDIFICRLAQSMTREKGDVYAKTFVEYLNAGYRVQEGKRGVVTHGIVEC